jgi:hypothetical protein
MSRVEVGVKFMKHFKGGATTKVWEPLLYALTKPQI